VFGSRRGPVFGSGVAHYGVRVQARPTAPGGGGEEEEEEEEEGVAPV